MFRKQDAWKVVGIVVLIMMWVALSGVGGLMWQNSDHWWRNEIYELLVTEKVAGNCHLYVGYRY